MADKTTEETTEIVIPTRETLVAPIVAAKAEIQKLIDSCKGVTVAGHTEGELAGYRTVTDLRKKLKGARTSIEKARKDAKAPFLELGRYIDSEAGKLEDMIRPEESRLQQDEDAYLGRKAEEKRKADQASAQRLEDRIKAATERGALVGDLDMKCAREGSDLAWEEHMRQIDALVDRRALVAERRDILEKAGAVVIPADLGDLDESAFDALLEQTIEDTKEREREALAAQEEREREESRVAQERENRRRYDLLVALGQPVTIEAVSALLPEEFEEALGAAQRSKNERDQQAERDRKELADLRERQQKQEREEANRKRQEEEEENRLAEHRRQEALRPEKDRMFAWAKAVHSSLLGEVEIEDPAMRLDYEHVRDTALFIIEGAMSRWETTEEPEETIPELEI